MRINGDVLIGLGTVAVLTAILLYIALFHTYTQLTCVYVTTHYINNTLTVLVNFTCSGDLYAVWDVNAGNCIYNYNASQRLPVTNSFLSWSSYVAWNFTFTCVKPPCNVTVDLTTPAGAGYAQCHYLLTIPTNTTVAVKC